MNEHSHNTRRASQEMTVTVDPPPEPAIYLCRTLRAWSLLHLSRIAHRTSHDLGVSVKSLPDVWTDTLSIYCVRSFRK